MAAVSKIFTVSATYPSQVTHVRLQDKQNTYGGIMDLLRRTLRNEGAIGFYKGIIPTLLRVTSVCCVTFIIYENISRILLMN